MKILLTANDISVVGGLERVVANLANAFCERGVEVAVFSFLKSNQNLPFSFSQNVQISFSGFKTISLKKPRNKKEKIMREVLRIFVQVYNGYLHYKMNQKLCRILDDFQPNIVLSNDFNQISKTCIKRKKIPFVKMIHGMFEVSKEDNLRDFKHAILLTSQEKALFENQFPHCAFSVIPNFLPKLPVCTANYQQKIILSIGRITLDKGFDRLIEIYHLLKSDEEFWTTFKEWKLIIVGDGAEKERLKNQIKELQLEDFIVLKPFTQETQREYLQASIYATASRTEGFGMAIAEAGSYALPCISFDLVGPKEIIEQEKSGFLIPNDNLQEYAEKLKLLMREESLRERFGKRGREIVGEKFSQEKVMQEWNLFLKNLEIPL